MDKVTAKHRQERQNQTKFRGLIAAPANGAVTLPAGARIAFKSRAGAVAGTQAATIVGTSNRAIKVPALAAGGKLVLDYVERGARITPSAGFDVMVDVGLGKFAKIAGA